MAENQNEIPMDQEKEYPFNRITLTDEAGNDVAFEFLDLISYEGTEYVVLLPPDEDGTVVLLEVEYHQDGSEAYLGIQDDELLEKLFQIFKERNKDLFQFG